MSNKRKCPKCGSNKTIPIIYGLPTAEAYQKAKRGEIALGGCLIKPENPDTRCKSCHFEWNECGQ